MVETVGKRLQQARLTKQISIEEAAHATKVRAERIVDLENDDYTNFPNMAYAKGFLLIYAKYLGVDVSEFADSLEYPNPVGVEDYQYLNHEPAAIMAVSGSYEPKRSWKPVIAAVLLLGGGALIMNFIVNFQRLGNLEKLSE